MKRHEWTSERLWEPGIDVVQLASYLDRRTASQAMREYRAALKSNAGHRSASLSAVRHPNGTSMP